MPRKPTKPKALQVAPNFDALVGAVRQVHEHSAAAASRAVNVRLTLRNWAIGCYIVEYEQNCADRAEYGAELLDRLADHLSRTGVNRTDVRELRRYLKFYAVNPQIRESVTPGLGADGKTLVTGLSFTHFGELIEIEDPLKIDSRLFVSKISAQNAQQGRSPAVPGGKAPRDE